MRESDLALVDADVVAGSNLFLLTARPFLFEPIALTVMESKP